MGRYLFLIAVGIIIGLIFYVVGYETGKKDQEWLDRDRAAEQLVNEELQNLTNRVKEKRVNNENQRTSSGVREDINA